MIWRPGTRGGHGRVYNAVVKPLTIPQASYYNATWCPSVNIVPFREFLVRALDVGSGRPCPDFTPGRGTRTVLELTGRGARRALICYEGVLFGAEARNFLPEGAGAGECQ